MYRLPSAGLEVPLTLEVFEVALEDSFAWGNPVRIGVPGGVANFGYRDYDLFPDGQQLVATITPRSDNASQPGVELPDRLRSIWVVSNWFELVKDRVPVAD
jgi:hypothetical protein